MVKVLLELNHHTQIAKCSYTKSPAREIVPGKVASKYTAAFLRGCDKWEAIGDGGGNLYKLFRKGTLQHRCLMHTLSLKITKPPP
jgi:hypothetical protein